MEGSLLELAAQYGITGSLLALVLFWLARQFLPERDRQHRAELERILASHQQDTRRLAEAVDHCVQVVAFNSQALLVQGFTRQGLSAREAEEIVRRIMAQSIACPARARENGPPAQA
jgi:hypothetical protein